MSRPTTELTSLLDSAESIAAAQQHAELDPGHVLLAVIERGFPLSRSLMEDLHLDAGLIRDDLTRRLGGRGNESVGVPDGPGMTQARAVAETWSSEGLLSAEALVMAVWNAPGPTARFTHRGRWLATAELRTALGIAGASDGARLALRRQRIDLSRRLSVASKTPLGRPFAALYKVGQTLFNAFTTVFGAMVNFGALLLLWPGIVVREGGRVVLARLLGSRRRSPALVRSLGSEYYLDPVPGPGRTGVILLVPNLLTFVIGVVLLLQPLIDARTTGRNPLPAFTSRGAEVISADETELVADFLVRSPASVWFGLACLFMALPSYATVRQARAEFSACGPVGRAAGVAIVPLALVTACLAPVEWIMSKLGFNSILGVGLLTLLVGAWLAATIVEGALL